MVSIIIPVYNAEKTLKKCIDSVLGQDYADIELLLIDDESTDASGEICAAYAAQDSRVKYIRQKNGGPSAARNTGLTYATGKYVQFVDSDDFVQPNMTKELVALLENNGADLAICGYRAIGKQNTRDVHYTAQTIDLQNTFVSAFQAHTKMFYSLWTKLYVREKITCFFNEKYVLAEDWVFNCHYLDGIAKIAVTDQVLYNYYAVAPSITRFHYRTNQQLMMSQYQEVESILQKKASEKDDLSFFYRNYIKDIINNAFMEHRGKIRYAQFEAILQEFAPVIDRCNLKKDGEADCEFSWLANGKIRPIYAKRKRKYRIAAIKMAIKRVLLKK